MSSPLSIRFDDELLDRLRRCARATPGSTASGIAQRLIDEGLRMEEHPGIVFKDGPSGRRAALSSGPDVWEAIKFVREIDERGDLAVDAAAETFVQSPSRIRAALNYYSTYQDEIDAEIAEADAASEAAESAWRAQQELLA